jgi:C-terminal processing protease CtpA/Prc
MLTLGVHGNEQPEKPRAGYQPYTGCGSFSGRVVTAPSRLPAGLDRLGVRLAKPTETLSEQLGLGEGEGLVVQSVQPGSAADKAGLKRHDILIEFAGMPVVGDAGRFARVLQEAKADLPMEAKIVRNGRQQSVKGLILSGAGPR